MAQVRSRSAAWVCAALSVVLVAGCMSSPQPSGSGPANATPPASQAPNATTGAVDPTTGADASGAPAQTPGGDGSTAFGPLPAPLKPTGTTTQARAKEIVAAIRAGGDRVLPALEAAFIASGIPVLDADGRPVPGSEGLEGVGIEAWALQVMADLDAPARGGMTLEDLGAVIDAIDPSFADLGSAGNLLEDIRTGAESSDETTAMVSNLLAQLAWQRDESDLLRTEDPAEVVLDGVGVQLVLHRVAADILVGAVDHEARAVPAVPAAHLAVARIGPAARPDAPDAADCEPKGVDKTIAGLVDQFISKGMKGVKVFDWEIKGIMSLLKSDPEIGETVDEVSHAVKWVNALADIAKFVMAYALLKIDVELEGGEPLVRTKAMRPQVGEVRTLVAHALLDTKRWESVNCLKTFLSPLGIKITVPTSDPLANRPIEWQGVEGFKGELVEFRGDPVHQRTDGTGTARMTVEGVGQRHELPSKVAPLEEWASVRVTVAIKDTSLGGDISDAVGVATAGPLLPLKAALETIYRTKLLSPQLYRFKVRDWGERWSIRLKLSQSGTGAGKSEITWDGTMYVSADGSVSGGGRGTMVGTQGTCTYEDKVKTFPVDDAATFVFRILGTRDGNEFQLLLPGYDYTYVRGPHPELCEGFFALAEWAVQHIATDFWVPGGEVDPLTFPVIEGTRTVPVLGAGEPGAGGQFTFTVELHPLEE